MELTTEQQTAYNYILEGKNVFLTGPGGTGKSYFIDQLRRRLPEEWPDAKTRKIGVTALTGCAAILLGHGAKTIHSWAGIGFGKGTVTEIVANIKKSRKATTNWLTTRLLIIDEISMMSAELFDKLNQVAQKIRHSAAPFGGLQLLLCGDFYQLPPVIDAVGGTNTSSSKIFAFEAESWSSVVNEKVVLTIVHRQKDDIFKQLLERVRCGTITPEDADLLRTRKGLDWSENTIKPTLLFPIRSRVDAINNANLKALTGESIIWKAKTIFTATGGAGTSIATPDRPLEEVEKIIAYYDKDAPYDDTLELRNGAQVMLITNLSLDTGLVNGSRGIVVGFNTAGPEPLPIVEFLNGRREIITRNSWAIDDTNINRSQIPLRLAYAVTIHKVQGATLDCALIDIGRTTFEYGQAYVALSRVKSLDALYIYDFNEAAIRAHPKVKEFYEI